MASAAPINPARLIGDTAAANATRPALIHQGGELSYADLWQESSRAAQALLARGVRAGDRIASWSPNTVETIIVQCAALRIRAVIVHLDPDWPADAAADALKRLAVRCMFLRAYHEGRQYPAMIKSVQHHLTHLRHVITHGRQPRFERVLPGGWMEFIESATATPETELSQQEQIADDWPPGDRWLVAFPDTRSQRRFFPLGPQDLLRNKPCSSVPQRTCLAAPLHRPEGLIGCISGLRQANCIVIPPADADAASILDFARDKKCTHLIASREMALTLSKYITDVPIRTAQQADSTLNADELVSRLESVTGITAEIVDDDATEPAFASPPLSDDRHAPVARLREGAES